MVGAAVSVTGPIGFVGLIVPHMLRMTIGPDYRVLLPASVLSGGAFLALCDTLARVLIAPSEMPVGVITAMLGGPFFIFLLLRRTAENF
jgi:iron complex transport system permease protein